MDHHNNHHQIPLQPPPFTVTTDPPPPYFTGFIPPPPAPPPLDLNTSSQQFQQQQQQPAGFVDPGPKRRPGRPPRARTEPALGQAQSLENGGGAGEGGAQSFAVRKRGRPPKQQVLQPHGGQGEHQIMMEPTDIPYVQPMPQPEPITSVDGLGAEEKRGPRRPPKLTPQRKAAQVNGSAQLVEGLDQAVVVVVVKRKRGRPARTSLGGGLEGGGGVGKPRGRPKRSGLGPVSRPVGKRPRGRPPRGGGGGGGGGAVVVGKRRGRPCKVGGGPPKVRRLSASGKPMGRPRKSAASLNQVSEQTANEELTKKLDLFQSKIKDAIDVLRPYIPHENAPLMALQQLEELAAPPVTATPLAEIAPMPVNLNAPPPTGTVSGPPPESESAPFMNLAGPFSVTVPFQVQSSFDNQQRMS